MNRPAFTSRKKRVIIEDVSDSVFEFTEKYPAQCKDGWPINWRRYVNGMRRLGREVARTNLQQFQVQSLATHGGKQVADWIHRNNILAEW